MARTKTIYIELLDEGTPCWRPVDAEELGGELYRITGQRPDDEIWAFVQGDIVKCRIQNFQESGSQLVAFEKTSQ